ncbi:MAG TPA: SMP-30/gluconolactonase/LRE family protein [Levilinea sp.]|nr:SMP-30/gluconolactonase/LRE family protein [Levilinea sp.]
MPIAVDHVVKVQNQLGECPLWHPRHNCLYWVDIDRALFYRYQPKTGALVENRLEMPIYALALDARHGLVAGTHEGFVFYDPDSNSFEHIAEVISGEPERRFNDGAVDRYGRFWAGTLDRQRTPTNHLYRLGTDLSVRTMDSGIIQSNGIDWSPDWRTMYLTDTRRRSIYAYDFNLAQGEITNRRVLIKTPDDPAQGSPDGLVVDAEGFIWSARFRGWKLVRYDPAGKIEREIHLPVQRPSSMIFGGENLDELYITTSSIEIPPESLKDHPMAGGVLRIYPGVKGKQPAFFGKR